MAIASARRVIFDELFAFLASSPSAQEIIAFRPSEKLQGRFEELLERSRHGGFPRAEQEELDDFLQMNHFMNRVRIHARKRLQS